MDAIKDWAMCMCVVAVVGAAVNMLASGSKYEKAIRFAFAAMAVCAIAAPLGNFSECGASYQAQDDAYLSSYAHGLEQRIGQQTSDAVTKAVSTVVGQEMESLGVYCDGIDVTAGVDDSGCIYISEVVITTDRVGYLKREQIKDRLFARLGLEVEVLSAE